MKRYLALGDSYTIGESISAEERFAEIVVKKLNQASVEIAKPMVIAVTGWTTSDLLNALAKETPDSFYDFVTLLIGVNNQYQGLPEDHYAREFELLLEKAIQLAAGRSGHVAVLSIPDYSMTPFAMNSDKNKIASEIDRLNVVNKAISAKHGVCWLDITADSRLAGSDPDLIAEDGLHFSGLEYEIWAEKLFPVMYGALK